MRRLSVVVVFVVALFVGCGADTITHYNAFTAVVAETVPIRLVYHLGEFGTYTFMYRAFNSFSDEPMFIVWDEISDTLEAIDTTLEVLKIDFFVTYCYSRGDSFLIDTVYISPEADSIYHFGFGYGRE